MGSAHHSAEKALLSAGRAEGEDPTRFMCRSEHMFSRAAAGSEPADCPLAPMELHQTPPVQRQGTAAPLSDPRTAHTAHELSVFQTPAICSSPLVCIPCILQSSRSPFLSLPRAQRDGVLGCPGGKNPHSARAAGPLPCPLRASGVPHLLLGAFGCDRAHQPGHSPGMGMLWGPELLQHRVRFAAGFAEDAGG